MKFYYQPSNKSCNCQGGHCSCKQPQYYQQTQGCSCNSNRCNCNKQLSNEELQQIMMNMINNFLR